MKVGHWSRCHGQAHEQESDQSGILPLRHDVNKAAMAEIVAIGRNLLKIPGETRSAVTCDHNAPQFTPRETVALGSKGIIVRPAGSRSSTCVPSAPLSAKSAQSSGKRCRDARRSVSGGEPKAIDGTLSIMVGGKMDYSTSISTCSG